MALAANAMGNARQLGRKGTGHGIGQQQNGRCPTFAQQSCFFAHRKGRGHAAITIYTRQADEELVVSGASDQQKFGVGPSAVDCAQKGRRHQGIAKRIRQANQQAVRSGGRRRRHKR